MLKYFILFQKKMSFKFVCQKTEERSEFAMTSKSTSNDINVTGFPIITIWKILELICVRYMYLGSSEKELISN